MFPQNKCNMYWPQEGTETHGVIKVTNLGQDVMATYTIRKFRIQHLKVSSSGCSTREMGFVSDSCVTDL